MTSQDAAERQRFESFSMPTMSRPSLPAVQGSKKRHSRSHSRNLSLSLPLPPLGQPSSLSPSSPSPSPSPTPTPTTPGYNASAAAATPNKRNSHHRRLSSVSTRHESAEIMGVAVPDLPVSAHDLDPEKDNIRRRALWALEGKPDSFKEVEIPQLPSTDDSKVFEFPTKPSFPPGPGLGSNAGYKRDSFKMLPSASLNKDQLGTLIEEEEEDEHQEEPEMMQPPLSAPPASSANQEPKRSRPRPNLRPLSLTPENLGTPLISTPPTEGIRSAPLKLKSLSLAAVAAVRSVSSPTQHSFRPPSPSTATTEESDSIRSKGSFRALDSFRNNESFRSIEPFRSFRSSQSFRSSSGSPNTDDAPQSFQSFRNSSQSFREGSLPISAASQALQAEAAGLEARQEMEHVGHGYPTASASLPNVSRRPELTLDLSMQRPGLVKRSSISYKTSTTPDEPATVVDRDHRISTVSSASSSRSSISSSGMWFNQPNSARPSDDNDSIYTPASSVNFPSSASFRSRSNSNISLSASEQHFLFKSHNALLARIQDLERTLSVKRRESLGFDMQQSSRPASYASDVSSDESLSLVAQLQGERDELKKDVDGWRTRVSDLEKQIGALAGRVDQERRDAWVARSRIGLLDAEKNAMEKLLGEARTRGDDLEKKVEGLVDELGRCEVRRLSAVEENASLRARIAALEAEREEQASLAAAAATPKMFAFPQQRAFGFGDLSGNSEDDSSTEIETPYGDDDDSSFTFGASTPAWELRAELDAVVEEEEEFEGSHHLEQQEQQQQHKNQHNNVHEFDDEEEEEEDALAGYEDEEDDDLLDGMVTTTSSSSFGSFDGGRLAVQKTLDFPESPITPVSPPKAENVGEMSKTWTFPRLAAPAPIFAAPGKDDGRDLFFGCLDDASSEAGSDRSPVLEADYSYETSKAMFSRGLQETPENSFAFGVPNGADVVEKLGTVIEEDEEEDEDEDAEDSDDMDTKSMIDDDDDAFGEVGGITITFTPAEEDENTDSFFDSQVVPVDTNETSPRTTPAPTSRKPVPVYEVDDDEDMFSSTFAYDQVKSVVLSTPPSRSRPTSMSRIPRAINSPPSNYSPGRSSPSSSSSAGKRGSFIPQRVSSPSRSPPSPSKSGVVNAPSPVFARQPVFANKVAAEYAADHGSQPKPQPHYPPLEMKSRRMSLPAQ